MDIVTWCKVPRYLHNDLPLGNPLGPPDDHENQRRSIEHALELVVSMPEPGVEVSELTWPGGTDWKPAYAEVTDENREKLMQMGEENRARRTADKAAGLKR